MCVCVCLFEGCGGGGWKRGGGGIVFLVINL